VLALPTVEKMQDRVSKLPLIIGIAFVVLAGVGAFFAISRSQNNEAIMVAKTDLSAYSFVGPDQLEAQSVPQASIGSDDLTKAEFEDLKSQIVITGPFLAGQRIDQRYIVDSDNASFAGVLPDERVVAANSTASGSAVGTIQAGDVVDVTVDGGEAEVPFAKVICIATEPSGCQGVLPAGVNINAADSGNDQSEGSVLLLLAVPEFDASSIAGQSVTLALNPFCRVDNEGFFYSPRGAEGLQCTTPSGRDASDRKSFEAESGQ
jgi:hypothetical protein